MESLFSFRKEKNQRQKNWKFLFQSVAVNYSFNFWNTNTTQLFVLFAQTNWIYEEQRYRDSGGLNKLDMRTFALLSLHLLSMRVEEHQRRSRICMYIVKDPSLSIRERISVRMSGQPVNTRTHEWAQTNTTTRSRTTGGGGKGGGTEQRKQVREERGKGGDSGGQLWVLCHVKDVAYLHRLLLFH